MNISLALGIGTQQVRGGGPGGIDAFLARISDSAQSGFFRKENAEVAGSMFTWPDENGGSTLSINNATFVPSIVDGVPTWPDATTLISRPQTSGLYTVILSFAKDASSASGVMLQPGSYEYGDGSAIALPTATFVDGVSVATRNEFHDAIADNERHTIRFNAVSLATFLQLGRNGFGMIGAVYNVAVIREDDFPSTLADAGTEGEAAVAI